MQTISGYIITEQLCESSQSIVYRAYRQSDSKPVILKVLRDPYPSPSRIAWFRREYEILRSLHVPGVVRPYNLETANQRWVMVLEDKGCDSLERLDIAGQFTLPDFLELAIGITTILGQIHQRHIIHKDINPSNIVFNPHTRDLQLIDFGIAAVVSRETTASRHPEYLEGSLAYISPEQTGRINRAIDYRTDFYSFGITLYELLLGQVPFVSESTLELIHGHIARQPDFPHTIMQTDTDNAPALRAISAILMKLLEKNPEDRYQSAYGLKADLEFVLAQVKQGKSLSSEVLDAFVPARHDLKEHFRLPQTLYGREQEIALLQAAYEHVLHPQPQHTMQQVQRFVLVSGPEGIGKSALVLEPGTIISQQQGYFLHGTFDQSTSHTPMSAFIQVLRSLVSQVLVEDSEVRAEWKNYVLSIAGNNGELLIEIIPELEQLIGPQPALHAYSTPQVWYRFQRFFQQLLYTCHRPAAPLVIFLDDLHLADKASLELLEHLLQTPIEAACTSPPLLLGAYRAEIPHQEHPLDKLLQALDPATTHVQEIVLTPLTLPAITQLIADTLLCSEQAVRPLAELIAQKTGGNPFFVKTFLTSLYEQGMITFSRETSDAGWHWDITRIAAQEMTENVVELLSAQVQRLEQETRETLKKAACIGNQFDLVTLALLMEQTVSQTALSLMPAIDAGLVIPLSNTYKVMVFDVPGLEDEVTAEYVFAHTRIRTTIEAMLPEPRQHEIHWRVGQILLQNLSPAEQMDYLFDILSHFNLGSDADGPPSFRCKQQQSEALFPSVEKLAELHLLATRKARNSISYMTAHHYGTMGLQWLRVSEHPGGPPADPWQRNYELARELALEMGEIAYRNGDIVQSEKLSTLVIEHAQNLSDQARAYEARMQNAYARNQPEQALDIGFQMLQKLEAHLLEEPPAVSDIEALIHLPAMQDPRSLAVLGICMQMIPVASRTSPLLVPKIVFTMVDCCITYGNTAAAAFAYAWYGGLLCELRHAIDAGWRYGMLALQVLEAYPSSKLKPRVELIVHGRIFHEKEPIAKTSELLHQDLQTLLNSGDHEYASYAAIRLVSHLFYQGIPLENVVEKSRQTIDLLHETQPHQSMYIPEICCQLALNLQGKTSSPLLLRGEAFDEIGLLQTLSATNQTNSLFCIYGAKTILAYLLNHPEQAMEYAMRATAYRQEASGLLLNLLFDIYYTLVLLAHYPGVTAEIQEHYLKQVAEKQRILHHRTLHATVNYQHAYELVEAERARIAGQDGLAREQYDRAITLAHAQGYLHFEALANHLAGNFYLAKGQPRIAHLYLQDARHVYLKWGAYACVKVLEAQHPQPFLPTQDTIVQTEKRRTTPKISDQRMINTLDMESLTKALHAIASEIVLDTLVAKVMHVVIENAGAERGVLLLEQEGTWGIEVEATIERGDVHIEQTGKDYQPAASKTDTAVYDEMLQTGSPVALPDTIVMDVSHRRESIVINDARQAGKYTLDAYIQHHQPRSVLCMPLIHQGKLIGMLYLENRVATGVFTPDRLTILDLLANQAATSLENARLYRHMEDIVKSRTAELIHTNETLQQEIAERKWAEEALRESEAIYRTMFEKNHAVKLLINPKTGAIVDANPAASAFYGYTIKELRSKAISDINILPQKQVQQEMERARSEQRTYFLFRHRLSSGEIRDVEVHSGPIDIHGRSLLFSIIHDVTERMQAEKELQRHDAILEAISNAAQHFLKTSSFKQEIPIFLELIGIATGVSRVALFSTQTNEYNTPFFQQQETWVSAGQKHFFAAPGRNPFFARQDAFNEQPERQFPRWSMQLCQGLPLYGNLETFPADEQRVLSQQHISSILLVPIFVERTWWGFIEFDVCQGERSWSVAEVRAIEAAASLVGAAIERERMQAVQSENEERFRTVAHFTYDWEYWIGPHGNFLYVSPSCERITGYSAEAFQADPLLLRNIIHPDDDQPECIKSQIPFEMEHLGVCSTRFRIITRQGEMRWIGHVSQPVYASDDRWLGRRASNRDITEQIRAEMALRLNEERYRAISELVSDYAYALVRQPDDTFQLEWITDAFIHTTGYTAEDIPDNKGWLHVVHPDDRTFIHQRNQRLRSGIDDVSEFRILTRQGKTRWIREHTRPVKDEEQQQVMRIYGAARDITERKEAEEALRKSHEELEERVAQRTAELTHSNQLLRASQEALREREAMFRSLVESMDDIIFTLDTQQRHTGVFGRWLERYGLSPDVFLGKTSREINPDTAAIHEAANARTLAGEYQVYEWATGNGAHTCIQTSLSPIYGDSGEITGLVGVGRDITPLKQAEQELRRVNRSLKTLSDCNQVLVRATDEQQLLNQICEIIVQEGGYCMVWVGFAEQETDTAITPVAQMGITAEHLQRLACQQAEQAEDNTPMAQTAPWQIAMTTHEPCIVRNIQADPTFADWQQDAADHGYHAVIALPLLPNEHMLAHMPSLGVMSIYSQQTEIFDAAEIELLAELANDLLYGINALRTRNEYQRTASRLSNILDIAANAILAVDANQRIKLFNPSAELIFGYTSQEVLDKPFDMLLGPESIDAYYAYVHEVATMTREQISGSYIEIQARRRYRSTFPAEISVASSHHDGEKTFTIILRDITAQKQAEEDLIESRNRIANILESITDAFFALDNNWRFIYINREAERLLSKSREELWDQNVWEVFPEAVQSEFYSYYHTAFAQQTSIIFETFYTPWETWFEAHAYPSHEGLSVYFRDITDRKQAERELRRVNRALKTLSECNKTVVRASDEQTLLQNICQNIVQLGGYRMAWVGFAEQDATQQVRPVAQAGYEDGYLETLQVTWTDVERGRGPTGNAIRTRQPYVVRNIQTDPSFVPWREDALKRGYGSVISLPLKLEREDISPIPPIGAISIYASEMDAFDAAEIELLMELADDLAYGIMALRIRKERQHAEAQLRYQKTLLECQSEAAFDGILVTSREREWLLYNRRFVEMWGIPEEVLASASSGIALESIRDTLVDPEAFTQKVVSLHENHQDASWEEIMLVDGRTFELYTAPVVDAEQVYYGRVWFYRDITERTRLFEELRVAHERLQMLSRRLVEVQETERRHIARELHDEIGQALTGLHLLLEMINRSPEDQVKSKLADARLLVNDLMTQVREMSLDLRPAMLDDLGLLPTLRWYFNRYTSQTDIHVTFKHTDMEQRFAPEIETVVYRLIQEALTNVARYAQVNEVTVRLWSDEYTLSMHIEDQGKGFDPQAALASNASSGLAGMQERVTLLGGNLEIESEEGQGTCVVVELPL